MGARVKKDVKLLVIMVVVLSLFNLLSMQVILSDSRENGIEKEFGNQALPSQDMRQDVVSSDTGGDSDGGDSAVFDYVNNKLKRYGYDLVDFDDQTSGSGRSSSSGSSDDSSDNTTSSDDQQDDSSGDGGNQDDSSDDGQGGQNDGNKDDEGSGEVPPNDDGPPAESVDGRDLSFDLDFGFG